MSNDRHEDNSNILTEEDFSNSDIEIVQEELSRISFDETSVSGSICDIFPKTGRLTPGETEVINYLFGLEGEHLHTVDETCERFRITGDRIRQIMIKAGGRMYRRISSDALRKFLEPLGETESEYE